ncbi:MAG TPA: CapA family protein [Acidimicrobiia bacterium]|jgi:poly-gamma-glutamate synthesis protein (capsule biosynthesis protein)|nr:CapA family protein [Acidimicrobiia bacterium]HIL46647.1 CapA family protein [Acidimicrobiia bacterium]
MTPATPPLERQIAWRLTQLLALGAFALLAFSFFDAAPTTREGAENQGATTTSTTSLVEETPETRSFTLVASGELLVHEYVADAARSTDGTQWDFTPMFSRVAPVLQSADLALCHLETPLSADNSDLSYYPGFSVPFELAQAISQAGYDGCSVASNHSLDAGTSGAASTLNHLENAVIGAAGMATSPEQAGPAFYQANGVTVAHLSVTDLLNGATLPTDPAWLVASLDPDLVMASAENARADGAEFVVVSIHWGDEYVSALTDRQNQVTATLLASDSIDLIIGHGAHVPQPVIIQNGKYAVVGMGNFLSNQPGDQRRRCNECPPATQDGVMVWLDIAENNDGHLVVAEASYYPTWVDRSTYEIALLGIDEPSSADNTVLLEAAQRTAAVFEPAIERRTALP